MNDNKELESSLKKAKDRLKDLEKQTSSDKSFWQKEVIIPVALVLVVVVFIGVIFWVKKRKK